MDKRPLIPESVMATWIDIHLAGEELDWHIVHAAPGVSRMTIVREVPTKSNLGICSQDEVLAPSNARHSRHSGLPHSPSNKQPHSREGWFNKVVTGLLGLPGPIKPDKWSVQIKACHQGQDDVVLNWHRQGLLPWNLGIASILSSSFPSECYTVS
jgi:hypothetical protein